MKDPKYNYDIKEFILLLNIGKPQIMFDGVLSKEGTGSFPDPVWCRWKKIIPSFEPQFNQLRRFPIQMKHYLLAKVRLHGEKEVYTLVRVKKIIDIGVAFNTEDSNLTIALKCKVD